MVSLRCCRVAAPLLILICFLVDQIAAAPLPGVKWSALEIWEGSAAADVWLYADDYLDFRKYALSGLSDLGFGFFLREVLSSSYNSVQLEPGTSKLFFFPSSGRELAIERKREGQPAPLNVRRRMHLGRSC